MDGLLASANVGSPCTCLIDIAPSPFFLDGHDVELERALGGQLVKSHGVLIVQQRALEQQSLVRDRNLVVLGDALLQLQRATEASGRA